jgi:hypothetical protein
VLDSTGALICQARQLALAPQLRPTDQARGRTRPSN